MTPEQQKQVRPPLEEHHDRIQALLDKDPTASRQQLGPQIHAISDETHRKIHVLLTACESSCQRCKHSSPDDSICENSKFWSRSVLDGKKQVFLLPGRPGF